MTGKAPHVNAMSDCPAQPHKKLIKVVRNRSTALNAIGSKPITVGDLGIVAKADDAVASPDDLQSHPLADVFPLPTDGTLERLAKDIAKRGLEHPIILFEDKILDGRSRYRACHRAGVAPRFEQYRGDDPIGKVVSLNAERRHLSPTQRAMAAARLSNLNVGANQHAQGMSIGVAAEMMNISERSVARGKELLRSGRSDLIEAVEDGKLSISAATQAIGRIGSARNHAEPEGSASVGSQRVAVLSHEDRKAFEALKTAWASAPLRARNHFVALIVQTHVQQTQSDRKRLARCKGDQKI